MIPIAHRALQPENEMQGFRRSVEVGFKAIECDVHLTKDNIPVVIHDDHIFVDNGQKILYIKDCFSRDLLKHKVPTLEEVLVFLASESKNVHLYIEIKDVGKHNNKLTKAVIEKVKELNMIDSCSIISFNAKIVKLAKQLCPEINTGIDYNITGCCDYVKLVRRCNANMFWLYYELITEDVIKLCGDNGISVVAWTVNKKGDMRRLKKMGVKGIVSDSVKVLDIL